jgi:hypothetical protein
MQITRKRRIKGRSQSIVFRGNFAIKSKVEAGSVKTPIILSEWLNSSSG